MTSVAVLGLGRMGTAMAARLAADHDVRTWSRSGGGSPADAVAQRRGRAPLPVRRPGVPRRARRLPAGGAARARAVVNTTTVGAGARRRSWRRWSPRPGRRTSTRPSWARRPAIAPGRTDDPGRRQAGGRGRGGAGAPRRDPGVLGAGRSGGAQARRQRSARRLLASLRRALARGDALGLPRDAVLDVRRAGRARPVRGRPARRARRGGAATGDVRGGCAGQGPLPAGSAADTVSDSAAAVADPDRRRRARAQTTTSASLASAARTWRWLADARLDVSPEVVADPDVLRPLHAYALTHATGDPRHLDEAFLPTPHIEGYRDGDVRLVGPRGVRGVFSGTRPTTRPLGAGASSASTSRGSSPPRP